MHRTHQTVHTPTICVLKAATIPQEALKLKEQKVAKEVVVVSIGPKSSQVHCHWQDAWLS